jgi:hypothetical protein
MATNPRLEEIATAFMRNKTTSMIAPNEYTDRTRSGQANIDRRAKMIELLQGQADAPIERFSYGGVEAVTPPAAYLAKILSGAMAGYQSGKAGQEQEALDKYQDRAQAQDMAAIREAASMPGTPLNLRPGTQATDLTQMNENLLPGMDQFTGSIPARRNTTTTPGGSQAMFELTQADRKAVEDLGMRREDKRLELLQKQLSKQEEEDTYQKRLADRRKYDEGKAAEKQVYDEGKATERQSAFDTKTEKSDTKAANQAAFNVKKDYDNLIKPIRESVSAYNKVLSLSNKIDKGGVATSADDISLLFNFMKSNDPTSTVRESEFKLGQGTGGLTEKFKGYFNQIQTGNLLTPAQRKEIIDASTDAVYSQEETSKNTFNQYQDILRNMGIEESKLPIFINDPFANVNKKTSEKDVDALLKNKPAYSGVVQ